MILSFDLGLKHMGVCVLDESNRIFAWTVLNIETSKISDITLVLDSYMSCVRCDYDESKEVHVVLECQPHWNRKMSRLFVIMETYFTVAFPSFIIQRMFSNTKWKLLNVPIPKTYRDRKHDILSVCMDNIRTYEQNEKWLKWFESQNKQDDLADAYVQGLVYGLFFK